ncbi:DUF2244 domain-containing protein [Camelimonas abortus]|uniref:DUF2244 domain-containing protein n=1 Tax=Camelimonas abortus TaxID=1017184 RepID=A0ABV7LBZ4_9HYPH
MTGNQLMLIQSPPPAASPGAGRATPVDAGAQDEARPPAGAGGGSGDLPPQNAQAPHAGAGAPFHGEFRALITPHRSLGPRGFRLFMALVLVCSVIGSLPFVMIGAWPVAGFFGLDLLALYVAFRLSYERGFAFEEVVVNNVSLVLRKVSHRGEETLWRFNPLWTTLLRDNNEHFGLMGLALASRGEVVPVASELSPEERETFAAALSAALSAARRGELPGAAA